MYCVIRQIKAQSGAKDQIARRIELGFVPILTAAAGFVSYTVVDIGNDDLLTVSVFDDKAEADRVGQAATGWAIENLGPLVQGPPQVTVGEIKVRTVGSGQPRIGVMRRYQVTDQTKVDEILRRADKELAPLIKQALGFSVYTVVDAGNGVIVSLSIFESEAGAEESTRLGAGWVKDNLAQYVEGPPVVTTGQITLRKM